MKAESTNLSSAHKHRSRVNQPVTNQPVSNQPASNQPASNQAASNQAALTMSTPGLHTPEEIFNIARSLPCYQAVLDRAASFADAPIIEKQELYDMIADCFEDADFRRGLYLSPTGASTSPKPIYFPTEIAENHFQRSTIAAYLTQAGILTGESVVLNLFGSTMMYRSLEIFNDFCESALATVLPVSAHCPDDVAYHIANQFKANCIVGTSSRIVQFAKFMHDHGLEHPFEQIIFAGEPLPPHKERFLQESLKASSFCAVFGSGEAGVFGFKPSNCEGAKYYCPAELVHVEVVDADEDGFGTMVLTNLIRTRFPLLRYNSGDIVRLSKATYCGREMNQIEFRGRTDKSFQIGGEYVMLSDFSKLFSGLLDFQILLSYEAEQKMDCITLRLVTREQPDQNYQTYLSNGIHEIVKSDPALFRTIIEFVDMDRLQRSQFSQKVARIIDRR